MKSMMKKKTNDESTSDLLRKNDRLIIGTKPTQRFYELK